jgi:hypothetical protein
VELPWSEVDPQTHACDLDRVRPAIESVLTKHAFSLRRHPPRDMIAAELTAVLVDEYGEWANGWNWSPYLTGAGWGQDNMFHRHHATPAIVTDRVVAAIAGWRTYLELLDRTFAELRIETAALGLAAEVERAAARLLAVVAERTHGEDAWYSAMAMVLIWYLQAGGIGDSTAHAAVDALIDERFESWVLPDHSAATAAWAEVGALVGGGASAPDRDALADWRIVRDHLPSASASDHPPTSSLDDAHEHYIELDDRPRDGDRADRMAAALLVCRDAAAHGSLLTFDLLAEWQRIVLGAPSPVPLRTTDAFAKQGRERYGTYPTLAADFERALAQANDPSVSVATRAARVYLDVCFFHPFADGNARAARLALDFVVTAAGLILRVGLPLFALSRGAGDPTGLVSLERVVDRCLGTRLER